jgi:hypothetical protein
LDSSKAFFQDENGYFSVLQPNADGGYNVMSLVDSPVSTDVAANQAAALKTAEQPPAAVPNAKPMTKSTAGNGDIVWKNCSLKDMGFNGTIVGASEITFNTKFDQFAQEYKGKAALSKAIEKVSYTATLGERTYTIEVLPDGRLLVS